MEEMKADLTINEQSEVSNDQNEKEKKEEEDSRASG